MWVGNILITLIILLVFTIVPKAAYAVAPVTTPISPPAFNEDTQSIITLAYTDGDGDLATACTSRNRVHVTVTRACACAAGVCTIGVTGTANYNGAASFEFRVTAGGQNSNYSLATLNILPANDAPTMSNINAQATNEDTARNVTFTINDIDSTLACDSAHLSMDSSNIDLVPLSNIVWSGTAPNCTGRITPALNQNGTSTITFTVSDGELTAQRQFVLTVNAVNDPPVADPISPPDFNEDTQSIITLSYSDIEGNLATSCSTLSLSNVTVTQACACAAGVCTIGVTGTANYNGVASFQYRVNAGGQWSGYVTATLNILPVNDAPTMSVINAQATNEDTARNVTFTINDVDSTLACDSAYLSMDSSNIDLVPLENIVWSGTAPSCTGTITPALNQNGTSTITFAVSDGELSAQRQFVLTVNAVDDPPVADPISPPAFNEDTESIITLSYSDVEGHQATSCSTLNLSNVTVTQACSCAAGICTIGVTGTANYNGAASFDYRVRANTLWSGYVTATLNILPINDAPTMGAIVNQFTNEDTPKVVSFTIGDVDSTLACDENYLAMDSSNPTLIPNDYIVWGGTAPNCTGTITPAANLSGTSTITFIVSDGSLSAQRQFTLTVTAVNDPPVTYELFPPMMVSNMEYILTLNYSDAENDLATQCTIINLTNVTVTTACSCNGSGVCTVGTTSTLDYTGSASFEYRVRANAANSNYSLASLSFGTIPTGQPATDFDGDGIFTHNSLAGGDEDDFANGATIYNNNIYIVGSSWGTSNHGRDIAVWNVSATGSLNGSAIYHSLAGGNWNDEGVVIISASVDGTDMFYIFGISTKPNKDTDVIILRTSISGTLDASFGTNGVIRYGALSGTSNSWDYVFDARKLAGNKFLLTGGSTNSNGSLNMYLMKINEDGSLDTSFGGGDGIYNLSNSNNDELAYTIGLQSDGKIVFVGENWNTGSLKVLRLNSNGSLDTSFGSGGIYERTVTGSDCYMARGIAIQSDDHIVISGEKYVYSQDKTHSMVLRLDENGTPDTTFNGTGFFMRDLAVDESFDSVLMEFDGAILTVGMVSEDGGNHNRMQICRITSAGAMDDTFGDGGCKISDNSSGNEWDYAKYIFMSPDNYSRIYAVGASYNTDTNYDMAMWAFQ